LTFDLRHSSPNTATTEQFIAEDISDVDREIMQGQQTCNDVKNKTVTMTVDEECGGIFTSSDDYRTMRSAFSQKRFVYRLEKAAGRSTAET